MNISDYIFNKIKPDCLDKVAIIYRDKSMNETRVTYRQLDRNSNKAANMLTARGIMAGDRVFIYLERCPELYYFVLGILKCGAICCPMFSSFGIDAVKHRVNDCNGSVIVTQKKLVENIDGFKSIVVDDAEFNHLFNLQEEEYNTVDCSNEDIALIHYTSGTTSNPKGVMHCHKAVISHHDSAQRIIGLTDNDIYWCTADPAWITGSTYGILAPLSAGATMVVCDAGFRLYQVFEVIAKYGVTIWYTAPTLLRMVMREDTKKLAGLDISSLNKVYSVGEALNPNIIEWFEKNIGLSVFDTWFQTETGSIMIGNWGSFPIKLGSMGKPVPGITAAILDDNYHIVSDGVVGNLAIKPSWPSMFIGYWNNEKKYKESFQNGWYLTNDLAKKDEEGYYWFQSRGDDVINTAGHLISPFEIESVIMEHPSIAEVAVVGAQDKLVSEVVKAFVVLKSEYQPSQELQLQYKALVRSNLAPYAVPQFIQFVDELPKTASGKIMRRLLK